MKKRQHENRPRRPVAVAGRGSPAIPQNACRSPSRSAPTRSRQECRSYDKPVAITNRSYDAGFFAAIEFPLSSRPAPPRLPP
jgi:hypothetical protein